ncbi:hypothetical protein ACFFLZ_10020 [Photobacterium aphoticum]|uniref:Uncharacterized protein n=1 Tax=Photobacterium aphoticum TaxID=754436 RepID=A0A0J1GH46_9GAMM|nr:hypothetical protein [Photobacterium aphoticum]KLU98813.1 hypothetical protein ABT58_20550 [Photobacterium aphoticum]PSU56774.1 hypothetical protein C9I90_11930 [Photobacterium aphoticum]GHA65625.1 hypothetical protein GCM10007086_44000 [Photobacterium aphoticum]
MKNYLFVVAYFFVLLVLPKWIENEWISDVNALYFLYTSAIALSFFCVRRVSIILFSVIFYAVIVLVDIWTGSGFIINEKFESMMLLYGSSFLFILPMVVGFVLNIIFRRLKAYSRT